jgi:hypothetical protein
MHRPAPTLTRAVTAPSLQHRPSSASSSRSATRAAASLRHRISEIKSKAALVSQSTLRGDIVVEPDDPVRDALLLDRDSKLAVGKACQAREAEMIDIVETIYRGARKGRGLVVSPKDYSTKYRY